jgi:hypothetical protein
MIFSPTFSGVINNTIWSHMFNTPGPISIYSGVQPDPATFEGSWSSYKASNTNFLAHVPAMTWTSNVSNPMAVGGVASFITANASSNVTPVHSGTASWAVIWDSTVGAAPNASTIPTTNYLIIDAGALSGNNSVRLASTTLSTSANTRIEDVGFTLSQP